MPRRDLTGNSIVINVVGDTSQLTKSLNQAQQQINRFAGKSKIGTKGNTAADAFIGDLKRLETQAGNLAQREIEVGRQTDILNSRMGSFALKAGVAGIAVNVLGRNFGELGGEAGKFGRALGELSTGNLVGFAKAANDGTAAAKNFNAELIASGDAARSANEANKLARIGFDELATAARAATLELLAVQAAQLKVADTPGEGNLGGSNGGFDAISGVPLPRKRPGISQEQRNTFFDNDLTRALDRAQDGDLKQQLSKLKAVEQTLRDRLKVTKDITRTLRLEDEIAGVQRQQRSIEDTIAQNAKQRAEAAARLAAELKREREAREKALAEARRLATQAKQFRALGFAADGSQVVPGADNLRTQLASLTERLGGSSVKLSSKLKAQLDGVRKVLSGKFGEITRESRERIAEIFDTIRGEFDKGTSGKGPLTKTSGLDTKKILAGLGLSPADEAELRSRLSGVNSAGVQNVDGTGSRSGQQIVESHVTVLLDGQKVGAAVTRAQQKAKKRNPSQRRGPNRGK